MAGPIDDITPKVEIEGGDEAGSTLTDIGKQGVEAFDKVGESAEAASEKMGAIEAAAKRAGVSYDDMKARADAASRAATEGAAAATAAVDEHARKVRETAEAVSQLGTIGAEAFAKILEQAASGNFTGLATKLFGELGGAITEVIQKAAEFVEQSARMVETLAALSGATGQSIPELIGLKDAFASVGISTTGFERAIGRLAITIANDWASIAQNVRTSSDQQTGAMLHMQETALGVQRAYQNLQTTLTHTSQTAAHDALGIESAALSLKRAQEALSNAALESRQNSLGIESAQLSLRRAQMNLSKDEGRGVNASDEKALKLDQDRLAVKQAQLQVEEAQRKQSQEGLKRMEEELAVRKASQALSDARTKEIEDGIKGMNELKQAQLNISKARLADREAAERQHEVDLKDIPKISAELQQVANGQKQWTDVTNHTEISTQNLTKAIIKNAAAGKEMATTKEVFEALAKIIPQMGDSADASAKKIAIMQHTMGAGFRSGQASAAQMLAVFERGPEYLERMRVSAEQLERSLNFKEVERNLVRFNGAFAGVSTTVDLFKARLASILSVPLTSIFDSINDSLKSPTGNLNKLTNAVFSLIDAVVKLGTSFASGLAEAAGPALTIVAELLTNVLNIVTAIIKAVNSVISAFAQFTGLDKNIGGLAATVGGLALVLTRIGGTLALILGRMAAWVVIIGTVTTAVGLLVQGWAKLPDFMGGGKSTAAMGEKLEQAGQSISRAAAKGAGFTDKQLDEAPGFFGKQQAAEKEKEAADKLDSAGGKLDNSADKHASAADKLSTSGTSLNSNATKLTDAGNSIINNSSLAADRLGGSADKLSSSAAALTSAAQALASAAARGSKGAATGGLIRGPGGPTDDKAGLYALSDGEYVVKSAAVSEYGPDFFESLNNLAVGRFAMGGPVGITPPRATPTAPNAPSSILNLNIDGEHFNGLIAPEHVASKLKTYAVSRQTTAISRSNPSWMR